MSEAEWALAVILDGEKKHDLYSKGFSEATVDRIWNAYWNAYQAVINNPTDPICITDIPPGPFSEHEEEPDAGNVLDLAAIIRHVDGGNRLGAAALAEAVLSHPDIGLVLANSDGPAVPTEIPSEPAQAGKQEES